MGSFDGKVVLVTGASSGLGEAAAKKFADEGARVVLAARREDKGFAVQTAIKEAGGEALFVRTDVTRRADVENLIARTLDMYGKLDCAVNNAGIAGPVMTPLADVEEDQWDELMNTNLRAVFLCMKFEIPAMLRSGSGSIVNISSAYGHKPSDLCHAPYSASKYAVNGLSKSAAIDYGTQRIRVNVVSPGWTHSEIVDYYIKEAPELIDQAVSRYSAMNRVADASETAEAIAWLCSDAASYVNGAVLVVDGGDTTRLV
jgi:A-factor type gamma-butyrolactone 1'-reductase (1S-forming)